MIEYIYPLDEGIYIPPAPAGAAPTPDPILVINSLTFTPSKALAKSPGQ